MISVLEIGNLLLTKSLVCASLDITKMLIRFVSCAYFLIVINAMLLTFVLNVMRVTIG